MLNGPLAFLRLPQQNIPYVPSHLAAPLRHFDCPFFEMRSLSFGNDLRRAELYSWVADTNPRPLLLLVRAQRITIVTYKLQSRRRGWLV
jgi:hypothetical protein